MKNSEKGYQVIYNFTLYNLGISLSFGDFVSYRKRFPDYKIRIFNKNEDLVVRFRDLIVFEKVKIKKNKH